MLAEQDGSVQHAVPADQALALRQHELVSQQQNEERQYQYALKVLEAQAKDQQEQRECLKVLNFRALLAIVVMFVAVLVFAGAAFWLGKEAAVLEMFKYAFVFFGGGGVGYGVRSLKQPSQEQQRPQL